jgi:PAS domain S-box-containing protein
MHSGYSLRNIEDLVPGDHLCWLYASAEEHRALLAPFLRLGLERNEKVVYIVDEHNAELVLGYLRDAGLEVEAYLSKGQLNILTVADAYVREGSFDPDRMIAFLRSETERAVREGYMALRVTGEMSWVLRGLPGSERLVEYENKLNDVIPGSQCLGLCQYDRRRFDPQLLLGVLASHPIVILGTEVHDNLYYVPPAELLGERRYAAALDSWLDSLVRLKRTEAERKRAEEEFRRSQALLVEAQQLAHIGSWDWDIAGNQVTWSDELYRIYGLEPQQFRASYDGFIEWVHPEDRAAVDEIIQKAFEERQPFDFAHRIVRPDGEVRNIHARGKVMLDAAGRPIRMFGTGRDVTEAKRAEEALRKSNAMFEGLFEAAPDAILLVNSEGRIIEANRQVEMMFGYGQEELVGKPIETLMPARFRGRHVMHRTAYHTQPQTRPMGAGLELYGRRKDGSEFPVDAMLSPLETRDGSLVISVVRDITERVRGEEAIRRANMFSERLINSSLEGILAFDREFRCTVWNPGMERIFGVTRTNALGRSVFETLPFLREIGEDSYYQEALLGRTAIARDRPFSVAETGRQGFFEGHYSPIRDDQAEVVGGLGLIRDITRRKEAQKALEESEARFRTVFERAAMGIGLTDLDGRIIASNPALQRFLGYSEEELRGMRTTDFTHPDDLKVSLESFRDIVAGDRDHYRLEKRYVRKDGRIVWGHVIASVVQDAHGQPQFTIGMIKDITQRKQMESELAEVQHRLIEGREKERIFLAQELHDGPLQVLYGASYRLRSLAEVLPDEESMGHMVAAQASLQQVIRMLRTISGEMRPPTLAPFGLEKAIRSHAEEFQKAQPALQIKLDLMPDEQTLTEQTRLALFRIYQQAMNNIVRHARASLVFIRFTLDPNEVVLEIEDNGQGFQVPVRWIDLAREGHLGLIGMAERTEAIGGRFEIQSSAGQGTRIRVTVPCPAGKGEPHEGAVKVISMVEERSGL